MVQQHDLQSNKCITLGQSRCQGGCHLGRELEGGELEDGGGSD